MSALYYSVPLRQSRDAEQCTSVVYGIAAGLVLLQVNLGYSYYDTSQGIRVDSMHIGLGGPSTEGGDRRHKTRTTQSSADSTALLRDKSFRSAVPHTPAWPYDKFDLSPGLDVLDLRRPDSYYDRKAQAQAQAVAVSPKEKSVSYFETTAAASATSPRSPRTPRTPADIHPFQRQFQQEYHLFQPHLKEKVGSYFTATSPAVEKQEVKDEEEQEQDDEKEQKVRYQQEQVQGWREPEPDSELGLERERERQRREQLQAQQQQRNQDLKQQIDRMRASNKPEYNSGRVAQSQQHNRSSKQPQPQQSPQAQAQVHAHPRLHLQLPLPPPPPPPQQPPPPPPPPPTPPKQTQSEQTEQTRPNEQLPSWTSPLSQEPQPLVRKATKTIPYHYPTALARARTRTSLIAPTHRESAERIVSVTEAHNEHSPHEAQISSPISPLQPPPPQPPSLPPPLQPRRRPPPPPPPIDTQDWPAQPQPQPQPAPPVQPPQTQGRSDWRPSHQRVRASASAHVTPPVHSDPSNRSEDYNLIPPQGNGRWYGDRTISKDSPDGWSGNRILPVAERSQGWFV